MCYNYTFIAQRGTCDPLRRMPHTWETYLETFTFEQEAFKALIEF